MSLTPLKPALVFQNPDHQLLLPSCGSDLQLGLPDHLSFAERSERVGVALEQVGLAGLENRPIHSLSGGQKQRLAIAGALAGMPPCCCWMSPRPCWTPPARQTSFS